MDIQVRFDDDTTALLWSDTPCLDFTPLPGASDIDIARGSDVLRFCRGLHVRVWRITGGRGENEPLTGKWQSCRVETEGEQIERLTRERDAAEHEHKDTMEVLASQHALAVRLGADVSRLTRERDALQQKPLTREALTDEDRADILVMSQRCAGRPLDDLDAIEWLWDAGKRLVDSGRGNSIAHQVYRAHLVARIPMLVQRIRGLSTPALGDLINARARAGAARVEAEQAEERARIALKHAHGRDRIAKAREALAAAAGRRQFAVTVYEVAREAEQAASR